MPARSTLPVQRAPADQLLHLDVAVRRLALAARDPGTVPVSCAPGAVDRHTSGWMMSRQKRFQRRDRFRRRTLVAQVGFLYHVLGVHRAAEHAVGDGKQVRPVGFK